MYVESLSSHACKKKKLVATRNWIYNTDYFDNLR